MAAAPMRSIDEAKAVAGRGLEGDRYFLGKGYYSKSPIAGGRDITLIAVETVEALSRDLQKGAPDPAGIRLTAADTRRNIATSGVPLADLVDRDFSVGRVLLRGTRFCEPCRYLEEMTYPGVFAGLLRRGGLRAQILNEGVIRVGDLVRP